MNNENKVFYIIVIAIISILLLFVINKPSGFSSWKTVNKYIQPEVIVFIGDSITEGANFKDYFDNAIILNKGISGDTTIGILKRLDDDVYKYQPAKVFLLIGINDIGRNYKNENTIQNIEEIIINIKENCPNTEIYLQSIYPINNTNDKKIYKAFFEFRNNKDVIYINNKIKDIAENNKITYIDVYSHLLDNENNLKLSYTKEGLHLTKDGYDEAFKIIKPYLYN